MKSVMDVMNEKLPEGQSLTVNTKYKVIVRYECDPDHPMSKLMRVYYFNESGEITSEFNVEESMEELVEAVAKNIDIREFVRQQLNDGNVFQIVDMLNIIKAHPEVKEQIKPHKGCYYFTMPNPDPGQEDIKFYMKD